MPAKNDEFRLVMGKWANESVPNDLLGVARIAIQDTAEEVIDLTPVDTGFLVANWQPSLNAPDLSLLIGAAGNGYAASSIAAAIADLELGDVFYYSNNAAYARRINYGFVGQDSLGRYYNQTGVHMIEIAIGRWSTTVDAAAAKMGLGA